MSDIGSLKTARSISSVSFQLAMAQKRKLEAYATFGIGQLLIERSLASMRLYGIT